MKLFKIFKIDWWEGIALLCSILLIVISYFYKNDPFILSVLIGAATCIITAILIYYFQRVHKSYKLYCHYNSMTGKYIRIDMGQDNTLPEKLDNLQKENIGLSITLIYVGDNRFNADIEYWKSWDAKVKGRIEFMESNKMIASGTYKYYQGGDRFKDHFGKYDIFRFEDNADLIYIKYQHVFPRKLPQSPDENRGWEVWQKQNSS